MFIVCHTRLYVPQKKGDFSFVYCYIPNTSINFYIMNEWNGERKYYLINGFGETFEKKYPGVIKIFNNQFSMNTSSE